MTISTVNEVIDRFGGTARAAERLHVEPRVVSNWKSREKFPARRFFQISNEAEKEGFSISQRLFAGGGGVSAPPSKTA